MQLLFAAALLSGCRSEQNEGTESAQRGKAGSRSTASEKSRRGENPPRHLGGAVQVHSEALEALPLFRGESGDLARETAMALGLPEESFDEVSALSRRVHGEAKNLQAASFDSASIALDKPVVIPAVDRERLGRLATSFTTSLPTEVPSESRALIERMFRNRLEQEFGSDLKVTLRADGMVGGNITSGMTQDLLGLSFEVEREVAGERSVVSYGPVQLEGTRFDFLKVPPGVKSPFSDP